MAHKSLVKINTNVSIIFFRFIRSYGNSSKRKHHLFILFLNIFQISFQYSVNTFEEIWFRNWPIDSQRYLEKPLFRLILTPFTSFIFIVQIYIRPPISISQTIPSLLYPSASRPTHLLVQSIILSSLDRIGREIAVPTGWTEGISGRRKNKLSLERSSNDLWEQRILMVESQCPLSSS